MSVRYYLHKIVKGRNTKTPKTHTFASETSYPPRIPYVNSSGEIPIGPDNCVLKSADGIKGFPKLTEQAAHYLQRSFTKQFIDRPRRAYEFDALAAAKLHGYGNLKIRLLKFLIDCTGFEEWRPCRSPICYPSNAKLAAVINRSVRTARRYINQFVDDGFLTRRYTRNNNRLVTNVDVENFGLDLSIMRVRYLEFRDQIEAAKRSKRKESAQKKLMAGLAISATASLKALQAGGFCVSEIIQRMAEIVKSRVPLDVKTTALKAIIGTAKRAELASGNAVEIIDEIATMSTILQESNKKKEEEEKQKKAADRNQQAPKFVVPLNAFEEVEPISLHVALSSLKELPDIIQTPTNRRQFAEFMEKNLLLIGYDLKVPLPSKVAESDLVAILAITAEKVLRFSEKIRNPAGYFFCCVERAGNDNNSGKPQLNLMRTVHGLLGGKPAPETVSGEIKLDPAAASMPLDLSSESLKASAEWRQQRSRETDRLMGRCHSGSQRNLSPYRRLA